MCKDCGHGSIKLFKKLHRLMLIEPGNDHTVAECHHGLVDVMQDYQIDVLYHLFSDSHSNPLPN